MTDLFQEIVDAITDFDEVLAVRERDKHNVFFEVRTGEGRSQVVMAQKTKSPDGEEIVHMMSEIGAADPAFYEEMLTRNLQLRYSRIAIVASEEMKTFALVYSYPLAELKTLEFTRAFGEVAFTADSIERELYNHDKT